MRTRIFLLAATMTALAACGGRTGLLELDPDAGPVTDSVPHCVHPAVHVACNAGWCEIPGGCFAMGSPNGEACRFPNETKHNVTVGRTFQMHQNEVTQSQFVQLMGYSPAYFKGCSSCPVEQVNWHEAAAYCNALSQKEGNKFPCYSCKGTGAAVKCAVTAEWSPNAKRIINCPGYRLPTEAEWEYAYRAGTTSHYYNGDLKACTGKNPTLDQIAWYDQNSGKRTQRVGRKQPNPWGLYDMSGNVWEWTTDWWRQDLGSAWAIDPVGPATGQHPVVRGGSWDTIAGDMRAAFRDKYTIDKRYNTVGFRCVRTKPNK